MLVPKSLYIQQHLLKVHLLNWIFDKISRQIYKKGVRLLTGMDRNAPEQTGMDLHNRNGPQNSP